MQYINIAKGNIIQKINRFIMEVEIDGKAERVHLKNTGKLNGLLEKGQIVYLEKSNNPKRTTKYDLIASVHPEWGIVNIDSQANNTIMKEWLLNSDFTYVKSEYVYGNSRVDFYLEKGEEKYLLEVKGCTLSIDGIGYFPDAKSQRASKHLYELMEAKKQGYHVIIAFVIGIPGVKEVRPFEVDPEFVEAFTQAKENGVEVWFMETSVTPESYRIIRKFK